MFPRERTLYAQLRILGDNKQTMDPLFLAYSYFRRRKYKECTEICTKLLEKNPYDQVTICFMKEKRT